jgi:FMN reductase (NADPH)/FMN reductase [NAD(P)H]
MNETLDLIHRRRSVRAYSDQPVTREEKDRILAATMRAPTAGNLMLYTIIEVEDQAIKDRLAVTCDDQPFIARAPFVLLFLADYQRWYDYFNKCSAGEKASSKGIIERKPQTGDLMLAACDALIAAQTAVIAAEALGMGSCYIGDILEQYETHRAMFNLPLYTLPITMVCFGYPAPTNRKMTTRLPKEAVVHINSYRRLEGAALDSCFKEIEKAFQKRPRARDFDNAGQEIYFRKFAADFSVELNRSVREALKNWE